MHCRWKAWPHAPQTTGASSPGNLASGGQPSKAARQMPQTSSPASQVHEATARQCLMETRKEEEEEEVEGGVEVEGVAVAFEPIAKKIDCLVLSLLLSFYRRRRRSLSPSLLNRTSGSWRSSGSSGCSVRRGEKGSRALRETGKREREFPSLESGKENVISMALSNSLSLSSLSSRALHSLSSFLCTLALPLPLSGI